MQHLRQLIAQCGELPSNYLDLDGPLKAPPLAEFDNVRHMLEGFKRLQLSQLFNEKTDETFGHMVPVMHWGTGKEHTYQLLDDVLDMYTSCVARLIFPFLCDVDYGYFP